MQAMAKKPPKCPECGEVLNRVVQLVQERYKFNTDTGTYEQDNSWMSGSLEVRCPNCDKRLEDYEELGFAEGACNYPHGRM